jgi:hypothetical protein
VVDVTAKPEGVAAGRATTEETDRALVLVTDVAHRTTPCAVGSSLTVMCQGRPETASATCRLAEALDEVQYGTRSGPCLEAVARQEVVQVTLAGAPRWPALTELATSMGVAGVLSLPVAVKGRAVAALNVYTGVPRPVSPEGVLTACLLAEQAGELLAIAAAAAGAASLIEQLREAVESRDVIGQAKGMLMQREYCSADTAFDILRRASQRENRKVRDVAAALVETASERARR